MASVSATCLNFQPSLKQPSKTYQATRSTNFSLGWARSTKFPSLRTTRFSISCSQAKPETLQKVCEIVRKQLALTPESELTPETKFSALGADSLDTVEIVMGLEEEFDINVEEESSENITTVQEAADLIEKLVQKKPQA
ncbi:Acyl carrier protein [Quillaja saponaria]|uniref:Acyl carrier protein n=1 Tax=Quillaja saponaria TaxID=32244 RepID=A0AAD7P846_QUISA|nr:Acyl carrier protein [Quillaja saponaria]